MNLDKRTTAALGVDLMRRMESLQFCIVGCGGTGANFADMLVRTGASRLTLIDGGKLKESDLNRLLCFTAADVGKPKVEILEKHLKAIGRRGLQVCSLYDSFRQYEQILSDNDVGQRVRDEVHDADVVFAATDTNTSRLAIEELCRNKGTGMLLCCGVHVDREAGVYEYECAWSPKTPPNKAGVEGYGPENASFASIVMEATSVAFTMLLSHLRDTKSQFTHYRKTYGSNLAPAEPIVS